MWPRYSSRNREAIDRSASGTGAGMSVWEKSGASQNSASAAATWTRRSGRSRSLSPFVSSPPTWSICRWVSTTSVTAEGSIPAASKRWTVCPARGKSGNSTPSPASTRMVRSPVRTTTTLSGQSSTSLGRNRSSSQLPNSVGSALVAIVRAVIGNTPSLITSTSMSPTCTAYRDGTNSSRFGELKSEMLSTLMAVLLWALPNITCHLWRTRSGDAIYPAGGEGLSQRLKRFGFGVPVTCRARLRMAITWTTAVMVMAAGLIGAVSLSAL